MSFDLRNIHPLSEFQQSTKIFLTTLKDTQTPIVLTVNGKAAVVIQDAESYQRLLERIQLLESLAGIRKSLDEFEQGQGILLDEAFQELRQEDMNHEPH